jgi:hypothetical protein
MALIMAADTVAGYIHGLLNGVEFKRRASREAVLARLFSQNAEPAVDSNKRFAA